MKQGQMFYTLDSSVKVIQVISSLRRIFLDDGETAFGNVSQSICLLLNSVRTH